ncbi:MAG: glycosyltransferase family 39 protein, partial [Verrucomicrobiota bacterium]
MTPRRLFYVFLGVLTVLRLFFIAQPELTPDEAYYYLWSERMDVCYYSKGPGVAATFWLGTHLFGVNEFGIRFFSPLLALGTTLLMFSFARRLYGESVGIWTGLMINLVPIF